MAVRARREVTVVLALAFAAAHASAEQLPLRSYTTADGLPHDRVKRIVADRLGFVWFCTLEGLGRFDGRSFVSFGVAEGLPIPSTNDLLETARGMWVATNGGGVATFDPAGAPPRFRTYPTGVDASSRVNVLLSESNGGVLAGTDGGLFRLGPTSPDFRPVPLGIPGLPDASVPVVSLLQSAPGVLVGTPRGLALLPPDGPPRIVFMGRTSPPPAILALADAGDGTILAGTSAGLLVLDAKSLAPVRAVTVADGLPNGVVTALRVSRGRVFIGTEDGLAILENGRPRAYGRNEGLSDGRISTVAEDRDGGIWIGTPESGAMRLQDSGSSLFDERDGLGRIVTLIFEGSGGVPCALSSGWTISCFDGRRFHNERPRFAARLGLAAWRSPYGVLRDHDGGYWFPTGEGLYRFGPLERLEDLPRAEPVALYTTRDGLASDAVAYLLEDREGDVWIGTFAPVPDPLMRWQRATGKFERFGAAAGLPSFGSPALLARDAAGNVWIGYRDGTLARHRRGRFQVVSGSHGFPAAPVSGFASDPGGRLWFTTTGGGLVRVDQPDADNPSAVVYGPREGVTGFYLKGLASDDSGRLVFGTDRELIRFDPASGGIEKLLPDRVLIQSETNCGMRDRTGALWFATWRGAIRILPARDRALPAASVRVSGVKVDGAAWPVSGTGTESLDLGALPSHANVSFEYFALGSFGQPLRFEHLLEGLDEKWSAPQDERSLHFARFAPGRYRFRVRAVGGPGRQAPESLVTFSVMAPIWQRSWFLLGASAALVGAGYAVKAQRIRRKTELDGVRARIASDLHDDLGAGLSRISVLAEVANLAVQGGTPPNDALAKIAVASREVDERLAEGIWTVDPARDDLSSLGRRLCLLADELLEPAGISWKVLLPEEAESVRLRPDRRREIYLLLKEAFANAARHSKARHLTVVVSLGRRRLVFELEDDGQGFAPDPAGASERLVGGRGLHNMRMRAAVLEGTLRVESSPGKGTTLRLEVPDSGHA